MHRITALLLLDLGFFGLSLSAFFMAWYTGENLWKITKVLAVADIMAIVLIIIFLAVLDINGDL